MSHLGSFSLRAPGNVIDWMYKRAGIKYSYAVHLRDTGTVSISYSYYYFYLATVSCPRPILVTYSLLQSQYGFSLPPEWIRPVGEETSGMVEYLAKFISTPRGY